MEIVRTELQKQEKETLLLDQEMRKLAEESRRAAQRLSASRLELDRLARDAARTHEERERKQALVAEKDEARSALERALEDGRSELEEVRIGVAQFAEEHSVLRVELAGLEERCRGVEDAMARLDQQRCEVYNRRANLSAEIERLAVVRTRLLGDNLALDQRATSLAGRTAEFRELRRPPSPRAKPPSGLAPGPEEDLKRLRQSAATAARVAARSNLSSCAAKAS